MAKNFKKSQSSSADYRINDNIVGVDTCRIIGDGIESKVMHFDEALAFAEEQDLDLIEINGSVNPPIMRVAAYDKFLYQQKKNAKNMKQKVQQIKEIQLRVNIASNDMKTKANKAKEFIANGDKVKVVLTMKGRELVRKEENKRTILEFITMMDEVAIPESMPKDEGNRTIVFLKPKKN